MEVASEYIDSILIYISSAVSLKVWYYVISITQDSNQYQWMSLLLLLLLTTTKIIALCTERGARM
jgi:hypothetical protein